MRVDAWGGTVDKTVRVTLDTDQLRADELAAVEEAASGLPVDFAHVTGSDRELETSDIVPSTSPIVETWVLGESKLDRSALGRDGIDVAV